MHIALFECSLIQKVLLLQYKFYNLSVPVPTVSTNSLLQNNILALNVLSIALYTFKNFNNIYILQTICHVMH